MENKKLNENDLEQVSGGLTRGVCAKDSSNKTATQSFCGNCSRIRRSASYSGNGIECTCSNGVSGIWRE